jgi:hypothetical protein
MDLDGRGTRRQRKIEPVYVARLEQLSKMQKRRFCFARAGLRLDYDDRTGLHPRFGNGGLGWPRLPPFPDYWRRDVRQQAKRPTARRRIKLETLDYFICFEARNRSAPDRVQEQRKSIARPRQSNPRACACKF